MAPTPAPEPPHDRPSLIDAASGALRRLQGSAIGPGAARLLAMLATVATAGLLAAGIAAWLCARSIEAESARLEDEAARAGAARRGAATIAAAFARPGVEESLQMLGVRLPPDARPVAIGRDEGGGLVVTLETADPDLLRTSIAADPVLARFVERAQAVTPGGGMQVTLAAPAGGAP